MVASSGEVNTNSTKRGGSTYVTGKNKTSVQMQQVHASFSFSAALRSVSEGSSLKMAAPLHEMEQCIDEETVSSEAQTTKVRKTSFNVDS